MADEKLPAGKMGPDGKLLVEGDEHPYVQGMIRTLWLDVQNIKLHRGYSIDESNRTATVGSRISGTGSKDKTAVMGILERGGEVRVAVVPSRRKKALQDEVRKHVAAGTALYTDALYRKVTEPLRQLDENLARLQSGQGSGGLLLRDTQQYAQAQAQIGDLRHSIASFLAGFGFWLYVISIPNIVIDLARALAPSQSPRQLLLRLTRRRPAWIGPKTRPRSSFRRTPSQPQSSTTTTTAPAIPAQAARADRRCKGGALHDESPDRRCLAGALPLYDPRRHPRRRRPPLRRPPRRRRPHRHDPPLRQLQTDAEARRPRAGRSGGLTCGADSPDYCELPPAVESNVRTIAGPETVLG